jgi:hypothetical protein
MTVALRSRLFRIAMLAFAVLLSQTANAGKAVRQAAAPTPRSAVKLCAAWPESRNDFSAAIKNVERPNAAPTAHFLFSAAALPAPGATNLLASQQAAAALQLQQGIFAAAQFRTFALRI